MNTEVGKRMSMSRFGITPDGKLETGFYFASIYTELGYNSIAGILLGLISIWFILKITRAQQQQRNHKDGAVRGKNGTSAVALDWRLIIFTRSLDSLLQNSVGCTAIDEKEKRWTGGLPGKSNIHKTSHLIRCLHFQ